MTEPEFHIQEVTSTEAHDAFEGKGVVDRIVYYEGVNTRWFLFGEEGNPLGHASLAKIGSGDESKDSCHYRFGKMYCPPEKRGNPRVILHAGCLIYHYLKYIMINSSYKTISLRAWNELVPKYQENGWIGTRKTFKGPFQELRKTFYFSWSGDLIEQQGMSGVPCRGILYKNDFITPFSLESLMSSRKV